MKQDNVLDRTLNVHSIFSSWTNQKGYPLLSVVRNYKSNTVSLKQSRFTSYHDAVNDTAAWWIPYNYATASDPNFNETRPIGWLAPAAQTIEIEGNWSSKDWVLFNKQQTGYYRVLYDENNWKLLSRQLNGDKFTTIHAINRAQLLDDLFQFLEQGLVKPNLFFDLFGYLKRDTDFAPWDAARAVFNQFGRLFVASPDHSKLQTYLSGLTGAAYDALGVEDAPNEAFLNKFTRNIIVNLACEYGLQKCLNETYLVFAQALFHDRLPHPNTRSFIFNNGIRSASVDEVSILWDYFTRSSVKEDRLVIASSLGFVKEAQLLSLYLNKSIAENPGTSLSKTERNAIFSSICKSGQYGLRLCIQVLKEKPKDVQNYIGGISTIVKTLAARVVTDNVTKEVNSYDFYFSDKYL